MAPFTAESACFDEDSFVSYARLMPLLGFAEQIQLSEIIAEKVSISQPQIKSGSANPVPMLLSVITGMCAGADSIKWPRRAALGWVGHAV